MRDYPGMPLGKVHSVLCIACQKPVTTLYAYPERRCGFTTTAKRPEDQGLTHVSCTSTEGNKDCRDGLHYDSYVRIKFEERGKLRASNEGQTGSRLGVMDMW